MILETIYTIPEMAKAFGKQRRAVEYAVETRGITEIGRKGSVKLYGEAEAKMVKEALTEIADKSTPARASAK